MRELNDEDKFLIIGTDGIFDVLQPRKAAETVYNGWMHVSEDASSR